MPGFKGLLGALGLLVCPTPSSAQDIRMEVFVSGNDLYARCSATSSSLTYLADFGFCRGYIYAAADSYATIAAETQRASCKQSGVTGQQIVDMVIQYLRDHPAERNRPGIYAVVAVVPKIMTNCAK